MSSAYTIRKRAWITHNNDPQRRCYNGCHFSTASEWTSWVTFETDVPAEKLERKLAFWRDLNAYAVKERGEANTLCEYEAVEEVAA